MKKLLFIPMLFACYMSLGQSGGPKIGDSYGGGLVFYMVRFWEPGYDPNTPHGLIAATVDQGIGVMWGDYATITGSTGTAVGTGLSNTNITVAAQGSAPISYGNVYGETITSYAAGLARAYRGGGYSDWYLPSKDELNKLWVNRTVIGVTDFRNYWSSSECSQVNTWEQNFQYGLQQQGSKGGQNYVRAIRSF
jgi:hypothetical protein